MAILTNSEVISLSRQNAGADVEKIEPYRVEALDLVIKPAIQDDLYIDLCTYTDAESPEPNADFDLLLNGGSYTYNSIRYSFKGLKSAAAYFAYSRFVKGIDFNPTQFGLRVLDVDQSQQTNYKDKIQFANDCESVGNSYLYDCNLFINRMMTSYSTSRGYRKRKSKYKIIGD